MAPWSLSLSSASRCDSRRESRELAGSHDTRTIKRYIFKGKRLNKGERFAGFTATSGFSSSVSQARRRHGRVREEPPGTCGLRHRWSGVKRKSLPQAVPRVMSLATPFPRTRLPGYSVTLTVSLPAGTGASRG